MASVMYFISLPVTGGMLKFIIISFLYVTGIADTFAAEFLMPEKAFIKQWEAHSGISWVDAVLQIKQYFGVSYKTVLYRLNSLIGNRFEPGHLYKEFARLYRIKYNHDLKNNYEPKSISEIVPALDEPAELSPFSFTAVNTSPLIVNSGDAVKSNNGSKATNIVRIFAVPCLISVLLLKIGVLFSMVKPLTSYAGSIT